MQEKYTFDNSQKGKVNRRKIIARNIMNLTDARYFAAWYVDYISYNVNPSSENYIPPEKIVEINNWVEGHLTLLEEADKSTEILPPHHGIIHGNSIIEKNATSGIPEKKGAIIYADEITADILSGEEQVYIDFLDQQFDFNVLRQNPGVGLIVHGGAEEKVGFKCYDELDTLYDFLNEE